MRTPGSLLSLFAVSAVTVSILLSGGCGSAGADPDAPPSAAAAAPSLAETGTGTATLTAAGISPVVARPYKFKVPKDYDASQPTPLLVLLHGFIASGELQSLYFGLGPLAESRTFLYAYPDGTQNPLGTRFWNATDACCDFFRSGVDDVAYIAAVIDDMQRRYNVDKKRIFVVGHSNGGFLAHRLACELSDRLAGIVSLAGMPWKDTSKCLPTEAVPILHVHGNLDAVIFYGGHPSYPSAREAVELWANRNRCTGRLTYGGTRLDLDVALLGAETKVERYADCPARGPVELWTIEGGGHVPLWSSFWPGAIYDFLMAHPRP